MGRIECLTNGDGNNNDDYRDNHTIGQAVTNNRELIQRYIQDHPASHLRKISKDLSLGMGDTQHHLNSLERSCLVKSRRIGIYKAYYDVSVFKERDESILAVFQQDTPRSILLYLIENSGATQREIANRVGFSAPTVNFHMSRLIQLGLVARHKDGRNVKYVILGDIKEITVLLKTYYPTIWDRLSNRLVDLFLDLAPTRLQSEKEEEEEENSSDYP